MRKTASLLAVASAAIMLSACFTGERPSFAPDDTLAPANNTGESGPASVADDLPSDPKALAALFGSAARAPETATYEIRPTGSSEPAVVAVVSRDAERLMVSVRDIQYRVESGNPLTCREATQSCTRGLNSQPLSDLNIGAQFWGPAIRQQLQSPTLASRIGPVRTTEAQIAGQLSICIDVPGPQVTDRYCALPTGLLATLNTAAVSITLTSYEPSFDETRWAAFPDA